MSSNFDNFGKQIAEGTSDAALREKSMHDTHAASFSTFYRFVVLETIFDPQIVDDKKIAYWEHDLGVRNIKFASVLPRNTIIAQRVAEGSASSNETPMFLFPMLPPALSLPCNPGEHVWVMFENKSIKKSDLGYWVCRIIGPGFVEDVNHTHMPRIFDPSFHPTTKDIHEGNDKPVYEFRPGKVNIDGDTRVSAVETSTLYSTDEDGYQALMQDSDAGKIRQYESVPRYRKRPGDVAFEGTNNSLIVLGQNRTGPVAEYVDDENGKTPTVPESDLFGPRAAAIDLVVGRGETEATAGTTVKNSLGNSELGKSQNELVGFEGDPDLKADRSRVLLTQRSKVDSDFSLDGFNGEFSIEDDENGAGSVVIKTDKARIIARSDIEFVVMGFTRDDEGRMIESGNASDHAAIIIKANGDIIFRPSAKGVIKLGGADADKALVCTDAPAINASGQVSAPPLITTMGGLFSNGVAGQGKFASKILVK